LSKKRQRFYLIISSVTYAKRKDFESYLCCGVYSRRFSINILSSEKNMKLKHLIIALCLTLTTTSLSSTTLAQDTQTKPATQETKPKPKPPANEEIIVAIRAVLDAQVTAWNRGDIDGFMGGYWRSDKLVFISGDSVTKGWQPTLDRYKKNYNTREKMGTLTFSDLEFNVLTKTNVVVIGRWMVTKEKENPKGCFTLIFKKLKAGWRIIHDHTS
jgi:ketosteroid isomerase-like protein